MGNSPTVALDQAIELAVAPGVIRCSNRISGLRGKAAVDDGRKQQTLETRMASDAMAVQVVKQGANFEPFIL